MKASLLPVAACLVATLASADSQTADQLVASKRQADISYRQLMELMGSGSAMIQQGIIRENPEMTRMGALMIADHPAPNQKPWTIVSESDRGAFKETLLSFNGVLHEAASQVERAAAARDWLAASQAAHRLIDACVACHATWKDRVTRSD